MSDKPQQTHHTRFYIVMATLIVGVILILLFLNDSKNFSLTSAIVGSGENTSQEAAVPAPEVSLQEAFSKTVEKNNREVDLQLSFDQVPNVKKQTKIRDLELKFDDLTTNININNDRLELNNLQGVTLSIKSFSGYLRFDRKGISLDGSARSIRVNDVALSSKGEIKLSFDNLNYDSFSLDELELEQLDLPAGDGKLTVAEKFNYNLEQDSGTIYFFNGKLVVDRNANDLMTLEGVAKGITLSGGLLDLHLQ